MKFIILIAVSLILASCGTVPPKPQVTTVYVKIKEPCISKAPVKPTYHFGKGAAPGDKQKAIILTRDFEAAEQYGNAWEAAAAGCFIEPSAPAQTGSQRSAEIRTPDAK